MLLSCLDIGKLRELVRQPCDVKDLSDAKTGPDQGYLAINKFLQSKQHPQSSRIHECQLDHIDQDMLRRIFLRHGRQVTSDLLDGRQIELADERHDSTAARSL